VGLFRIQFAGEIEGTQSSAHRSRLEYSSDNRPRGAHLLITPYTIFPFPSFPPPNQISGQGNRKSCPFNAICLRISLRFILWITLRFDGKFAFGNGQLKFTVIGAYNNVWVLEK